MRVRMRVRARRSGAEAVRSSVPGRRRRALGSAAARGRAVIVGLETQAGTRCAVERREAHLKSHGRHLLVVLVFACSSSG